MEHTPPGGMEQKGSKLEIIKDVTFSSIPSEEHPDRNEDSILVDSKNRLFGVFDGMGGHAGGQLASQTARDYIDRWSRDENYQIPNEIDPREVRGKLESLLLGASEAVRKLGEGQQYPPGTTGSVIKIVTWEGVNYAVTAHMGDSRVYCSLASSGLLLQNTEDQNGNSPEINRKISEAQTSQDLTQAEKSAFIARSGITHFLGMENPQVITDFNSLQNYGKIILTSDGIHDNLTSIEMEEILQSKNPTADALVLAARNRSVEEHFRSKLDDMSAIVIELADRSSKPDLKKDGKKSKEEARAEAIAAITAELQALQALLEEQRQADARVRQELVRELEEAERREKQKPIEDDRRENPFRWFLIDNMHSRNFRVIFQGEKEDINPATLEEIKRILADDGKKFSSWNFSYILEGRDNCNSFYPNGVYIRSANLREAPRTSEGKIDWDNPGTLGEVIMPDGRRHSEGPKPWAEARTLFFEEAEKYQAKMLGTFEDQETERQVQELATRREKVEFLERRRLERIRNIQKIKDNTEYYERVLQDTSAQDWQKENARKSLDAMANSPLSYYENEVKEWSKSSLSWAPQYKAIAEAVIAKIKAIDAECDAMIAKLQE